jgi:linoleoyl-CoA desaturase
MFYQMRTTNNFARGNRLLSWYVGGLNYQIEHHLFRGSAMSTTGG